MMRKKQAKRERKKAGKGEKQQVMILKIISPSS
jgi:hypothetical protein